MYRPPIDVKAKEAELKRLGYSLDDFATDDEEAMAWRGVDIWPENYPSYEVFSAMSTQWRVSMNGYTGLDYCALNEVWRRLKVKPSDRDDIFHDLRYMESVALEEMNTRKE